MMRYSKSSIFREKIERNSILRYYFTLVELAKVQKLSGTKYF